MQHSEMDVGEHECKHKKMINIERDIFMLIQRWLQRNKFHQHVMSMIRGTNLLILFSKDCHTIGILISVPRPMG